MARATSVTRADALTSSSRTPSLPKVPQSNGKVTLRPIKDVVRKLQPNHPLRVVVLSEPEEIDGDEYFVKLTVWLKLLPRQE
jgi:hypothetical protein